MPSRPHLSTVVLHLQFPTVTNSKNAVSSSEKSMAIKPSPNNVSSLPMPTTRTVPVSSFKTKTSSARLQFQDIQCSFIIFLFNDHLINYSVHATVTGYYAILTRFQPLCDLMIDYFCVCCAFLFYFPLSL